MLPWLSYSQSDSFTQSVCIVTTAITSSNYTNVLVAAEFNPVTNSKCAVTKPVVWYKLSNTIRRLLGV